jgi:hypothetical protein
VGPFSAVAELLPTNVVFGRDKSRDHEITGVDLSRCEVIVGHLVDRRALGVCRVESLARTGLRKRVGLQNTNP